MSERRRQLAGPPIRSATEVWTAIADLVRDTLVPAAAIDEGAARTDVMSIIDVGRVLVSAGHLEDDAATLIAGPLRLEISVVTGTEATTLGENLNTVPGAASATTWMLHVPVPESMAAWVEEAVAGSAHLTAEPAPLLRESASVGPTTRLGDVDAEALARVLGDEGQR